MRDKHAPLLKVERKRNAKEVVRKAQRKRHGRSIYAPPGDSLGTPKKFGTGGWWRRTRWLEKAAGADAKTRGEREIDCNLEKDTREREKGRRKEQGGDKSGCGRLERRERGE